MNDKALLDVSFKDLSRSALCLHHFSVMDKYFLFDPTTLCCVEADQASYDVLTSAKAFVKDDPSVSNSDIYSYMKLKFGHQIVQEFLSELKLLQTEGKVLTDEIVPQHEPALLPLRYAILNISHSCNLECKYCYVDGMVHEKWPRFMSHQKAREAVDFLLSRFSEDDISIGFFGGEPLLNFDVMQSVVEYSKREASKIGKKCRFHLTTNGTLLNAEIIDFLNANDFSMIVSLDGPKDIHDSMRRYRRGGGTFDAVMSNLGTIRGTKLARRTTLRSTYTFENPRIVERFLFLRDLCRDNYADDFSIEPASLPNDSPMTLKPENIPFLKREYVELAKIYCRQIMEGIPDTFLYFGRIMRLLLESRRLNKSCDAGNQFIAITPKGIIHACHREGQTQIGDIDNGFDPALREQWRSNTIFHKKPCPTCWARYLCGGECRYEAVGYMADPAMPFWISCELRQHSIQLCLWILSELNDQKKVSGQKHTTQLMDAGGRA